MLGQDVAHDRDGAIGSSGRQRLGRLPVVAGFQVSIDGRLFGESATVAVVLFADFFCVAFFALIAPSCASSPGVVVVISMCQ